MSKEREMLTLEEFQRNYGKNLNEGSRFLTKSFYDVNNTVSIFPEELDVDCYFQLPTYATGKVPDERRYIYLLKAGEARKKDYVMIDKRRMAIPISDLKIFADPYNDTIDEGEELDDFDKKVANSLIKILKQWQMK